MMEQLAGFDLVYTYIEADHKMGFREYLNKCSNLSGQRCFEDLIFKLFNLCGQIENPYYISELIQFIKKYPIYTKKLPKFLCSAIRNQNIDISHALILEGTDNGKNDNILSYNEHAPLEEAIRCNSYDLVCMVLYYGGYGHNVGLGISPLMASMYSFQDSTSIQELLLEYEDDFAPKYTRSSPLFVAIRQRSPLIHEILRRGGDINYFDGYNNVISISILSSLDPAIFKMFWTNFDYKVWEDTFSKCALLFFLNMNMSSKVFAEYLDIFMENEEKLKLDIQHHYQSYFKSSDSLISILYSKGMEHSVPESTLQSYVFHLLSYGVTLSMKNIDEIYYASSKKINDDFFQMLLYMNMKKDTLIDRLVSPLYFSYHLTPNIESYVYSVCTNVHVFSTEDRLKQLEYWRHRFAFSSTIKDIISDTYGLYNGEWTTDFLGKCQSIPSLTELARNKTRQAIIERYDIKHSCDFYTILKSIDMSQLWKNIILFKQKIYF